LLVVVEVVLLMLVQDMAVAVALAGYCISNLIK
jgi:hypothetical protein